MIIICPNCTTNYDIDPTGIGAKGRQVKCASCETFWHVMPEQEVLAVANGDPVSVPDVAAIDQSTSPVDETRLDDAFAALEEQDTTTPDESEEEAQKAEPEDDADPDSTEDDAAEDDGPALDGDMSHEDLLSELEGLPSPRQAKAKAAKEAKKLAEQEAATAKEQAEREAAENGTSESDADDDVIDVPNEEFEAEQAEQKRQQDIDDSNVRRNARMKRIAKRNRALANAMPAARVRRLWTIGSVFSLVATVLVLVLCREPIVRILPDLASLYRVVGMEVNVIGLEFGQIKTERRHDNGSVSLVVTGIVRNITNKPIVLPKVLVSLQTSGSEEVYAWSIDPSVTYLDIGEAVEFETKLTDPPAIADNVKLSFLSQGG